VVACLIVNMRQADVDTRAFATIIRLSFNKKSNIKLGCPLHVADIDVRKELRRNDV
jgi:hypothetical protein